MWFLSWFRPKPKPKPQPNSNWIPTLLELTNQLRSSKGIRLLYLNDKLLDAAQKWANWMAANRNLTHSNGKSTVRSRIEATSYKIWSAGENIAMGANSPQEVFNLWVHSAPHFENMVNSTFRDIGIGIGFDSNGSVYWCVDFASDQGKFSSELGLIYSSGIPQ